LATILPSALALAAIGALHRPVFSLLYDETFRMTDATVALFFAGTFARTPHGCRSMPSTHAATRSLAIGEFLRCRFRPPCSRPCPGTLTLEAVGAPCGSPLSGLRRVNLWRCGRAA